MRTIEEPIEGAFVRVEPADTPGIRINDVPAVAQNVSKADVRVDIESDQRVFVVEHVLGPLRLCGITAADVIGTETSWDFARPEHRFCYSTHLGPGAVVGHPAGLPNPDLATAVERTGVVQTGTDVRRTVSESVSYSVNDGAITVSPREYRSGIELSLRYGSASFELVVPPQGAPSDVIEAVTTATTPYLVSDPEEAVTHAVADVISDVVVLGELDDVRIDAELDNAYHALTLGVVRKAKRKGVITERR